MTILDADRVGHEVLRRAEVVLAIREAFGMEVINQAGEIDRSRLADVVFGHDAEARRQREKLERIVHPLIRAEIKSQLQRARESGLVQAVFLDAPILLESGWKELCDTVVFVDTPFEQRQHRTRVSRGWSDEELARRESSQWPISRKRDESDAIVDNSGRLDSAIDQLERIVRRVKSLSPSTAPSVSNSIPVHPPSVSP